MANAQKGEFAPDSIKSAAPIVSSCFFKTADEKRLTPAPEIIHSSLTFNIKNNCQNIFCF